MWTFRRLAALTAFDTAAFATTRRVAHTSGLVSSASTTPIANATLADTTVAVPSAFRTPPSQLQLDLHLLPPQLQREFDMGANQRALRHLTRRTPTSDNSSFSDEAAVPSSSTAELTIRPSTVHKVVWRCTMCGAQWSARPSDRTNPQTADAYRCPRCYGDAAASLQNTAPPTAMSAAAEEDQPPPPPPSHPSSLLCEVHPSLAAQWDVTRNRHPQNRILQDVTTVLTSSSAKVWWRCPLCRTPWLESVSSRVARYELASPSSPADVSALLCPACERRGVAHASALASTASTGPRRWLADDRLLLAEVLLRPSQNPHEISLTSETVLQWRCRTCQFEYAATVANRFLRHERCPQCTGKEKSLLNLLVVQRPDVVAEVSKHVSRTRLQHITVHDDVELPFVCRTCFSPYRMTARARCAVPRGVPACSKCFMTGTQVLAQAQQQMQRRGTQQLSSRARDRMRRTALQLNRSNRSADRLAATANELQHRDGAVKD